MTITIEAVAAVVSAESGIAPERLTPDTTLAELDISSLDFASILFELEDRFTVELVPEQISREISLSGLVDHINSLRPA
ncbi:MAG: acyl carrier protein [Sphingobium sp.]